MRLLLLAVLASACLGCSTARSRPETRGWGRTPESSPAEEGQPGTVRPEAGVRVLTGPHGVAVFGGGLSAGLGPPPVSGGAAPYGRLFNGYAQGARVTAIDVGTRIGAHSGSAGWIYISMDAGILMVLVHELESFTLFDTGVGLGFELFPSRRVGLSFEITGRYSLFGEHLWGVPWVELTFGVPIRF